MRTSSKLVFIFLAAFGALTAANAAGAQTTGSISGTMLDQSGNPVLGSASICGFGTPSHLECAFADSSSGEFSLNGLPDGDYILSFTTPPEYGSVFYPGVTRRSDATSVEVRGGEAVTGVDIVLEPGSSISGTIVDQTGSRFGEFACATFAPDSGQVRELICRDIDPLTGEWVLPGVRADGVYEVYTNGLSLALVDFTAGSQIVEMNGADVTGVVIRVQRLFCNDLEVTVNLQGFSAPTEGDDVIRGTNGDDVIDGLGGNDTICGLQGDDTITGGDGFDKVFAGGGNDLIDGGSGNDRLVGGSGDDSINGGNGNDRIQGGDGIDVMTGGNGTDRIAGGNGNDVLRGGAFDDELFGNLGNDQLFGDTGNDVLRGGAWRDVMDGGAGSNDGCTLNDPGGIAETRTNCESGVFGR